MLQLSFNWVPLKIIHNAKSCRERIKGFKLQLPKLLLLSKAASHTQVIIWQHRIWTTSCGPSCLSNSFINSLTPTPLLLKLLAFCEKERAYWHHSAFSFFCRRDVERLESQLNGDRRSETDRQSTHPFLLVHILFKERFLPFHCKVGSNLVAMRRSFMLFWALW